MSPKSLTIVLPVHNVESRLSHWLQDVLELASELTPRFSILVVDDGSTDDTSNVARELSTRYPQIVVRRHRQRQGLGPIINLVRRRVTSDVVIVHDGVTPIDTTQLRRLWRRSLHDSHRSFTATTCDVAELAYVRATHDAMASAHDRVLGFHLLPPSNESSAPGISPASGTTSRPSDARPNDRSGVGQIPPLPRPNFLSAVAQFALGE